MYMSVDKIKERIGFYKFLLAIMFAILSSSVGFLIASYKIGVDFLTIISIILAFSMSSIILWLGVKIINLINKL